MKRDRLIHDLTRDPEQADAEPDCGTFVLDSKYGLLVCCREYGHEGHHHFVDEYGNRVRL